VVSPSSNHKFDQTCLYGELVPTSWAYRTTSIRSSATRAADARIRVHIGTQAGNMTGLDEFWVAVA
jgi:hypothetical protein